MLIAEIEKEMVSSVQIILFRSKPLWRRKVQVVCVGMVLNFVNFSQKNFFSRNFPSNQ